MAKVSKKSKRRLMTFGIISILAIGYFCFTLVSYIFNYINLTNEEKALQAELADLKDEKDYLKVEIQKLNDPTYVARYAKEKFLYSSDGEFVIKINELSQENTNEISNNNTLSITIVSVLMFLILVLFLRIRIFKPKKI